jgi:hypothetical protein
MFPHRFAEFGQHFYKIFNFINILLMNFEIIWQNAGLNNL